MVLTGIFAFDTAISSVQVNAATTEYCQIKSCVLSSGTKVTVKAKLKKKTKAMGKKLYLIALPTYSKAVKTTTSKPVASCKLKVGTLKITASLNKNKSTSILYSRFVVAYKSGSKYKIISNSYYITNPEKLATYTSSYPKTTSKKGLQVEGINDALDLGVQNAVLNVTLNSIFSSAAEGGIPYKYKGKTYYFNEYLLNLYDNQIARYNENGTKVTFIILLSTSDVHNVSSMVYSGGSSSKFSAINMGSKTGARQYEVAVTYLANRYGVRSHVVSGWILGNEIDAAAIWNYGGGKSLTSYIENYVRSFRVLQTAVTSVNKNAKVYVSVDNSWNTDPDGNGRRFFSTKKTLDAFYEKLKAEGLVPWNIAFHCYSEGMLDPYFWDDSRASSTDKTAIITFKNLSVLTKYVKKKYSKSVKVMLSEQSFDSRPRGELGQAATYAYAYYIAEGNSQIDYFIYGRHVDNEGEGYKWGLLQADGKRRAIWEVFQYIDSKEGIKLTQPLLEYINTISSWSRVSGYKKSKFTAMGSRLVKAQITDLSVNKKGTKVTVSTGRIATATGYEFYRASSAGGNYELIGSVSGGDDLTYTVYDTNLKSGKTYYYKVRMYKVIPTGGYLYGKYSSAKSIKIP